MALTMSSLNHPHGLSVLVSLACLCLVLHSSDASPAATPCVNGFADIYPCANVDLLAFLPHSEIGGGNGNDVWGWTDPLTGREYAIVGRTSGTAFVDLSNPEIPVYLGTLPPHTSNSTWRDLEVYADHAFIVSEAPGHGIQVFDLTQLRSVTSPPVTFTETAHYSGFSTAHTLAINEQTGFAYANGSNTCAGGLHIVNIQNPTSPVPAGCFSADGYTHDSQCVIYNGPDLTHQGKEICLASNEDTLTIVDVTNKAAPVQLSRTPYSDSGYTHQGWLTDDHTFFLVADELDEFNLGTLTRTHLWDVSDLDAPQRFAIYENATAAIDHNVYIRGNLAYLASYRAGLRVLDLSGVSTGELREVAFFDIYPADDAPAFNAAWSAYPFFPSGVILVNGIEQGLFILRHDLAGTGMGLPNFLQSAAPATSTVSPGQSATYTVTATPQNGISGDVTFSCTGLPASANCSFSPNPLTLGSAPTSTTLTISTSLASTLPGPFADPVLLAHARFSALPSAFWLALLAVGLASYGGRKKKPGLCLSVAVLLAVLALHTGCGGGGGSGSAPILPPPCTFTVSPTSQSFASGGGSGSVTVTTQSGCSWTAASNAPWITITSGTSGIGSGTVNYSVAANTSGMSRTGTLTIAGQTVTVTQTAGTPAGTFAITIRGTSGNLQHRTTVTLVVQ